MHRCYEHAMVPSGGYRTVILVVLILCQAHWWYHNLYTAIFVAKKLRFCETGRAILDQSHERKPQPLRWTEDASDTSIGGLHRPRVAASWSNRSAYELLRNP